MKGDIRRKIGRKERKGWRDLIDIKIKMNRKDLEELLSCWKDVDKEGEEIVNEDIIRRIGVGKYFGEGGKKWKKKRRCRENRNWIERKGGRNIDDEERFMIMNWRKEEERGEKGIEEIGVN